MTTPLIGFSSPPGFELLDEVGRGGMGVVFRARDTAFDREVAVKLLLGEPDSPAARRFVDEAMITARLQHPGIPGVHQTGTLPDGRPYLVMKLIQGRTLSALLKEQGHGAARWLGTFEAVCQAVGAAHAAGYIHRDLKPANVMVGRFGEVQVMDWGLARGVAPLSPGGRGGEGVGCAVHLTPSPAGGEGGRFDDTVSLAAESLSDRTRTAQPAPAGHGSTKTGTILGTPAYMAPEQARGQAVDRRADVFALGCLLCELLTGRPPLSGKVWDVLAAAGAGRFAEPLTRLDGCGEDRELIALAKRCLSAPPADRPADAGELAAAVGGLRAAADERARRAELERERAVVRAAEQRKRWAVRVGALLVVLAVAAAAAGFAVWARGAYDQATTFQAGMKEQAANSKEYKELSERYLEAYAIIRTDRTAEIFALAWRVLVGRGQPAGDVRRFLSEVCKLQDYGKPPDADRRLAPDRLKLLTPGDAHAAYTAGVMRADLGDDALAVGHLTFAHRAYAALLTDSPDLATRDTAFPSAAPTPARMSALCGKLAEVKARTGRPAEVEPLLAEAARWWDQVPPPKNTLSTKSATPEQKAANASWHRGRCREHADAGVRAYTALADHRRASGDRAGAAEAMRRAVAAEAAFAGEFPDDAAGKAKRAELAARLSELEK